MTVKQWLSHAQTALEQAGIPTSSLDANLLLAHALSTTKTVLAAHPEQSISGRNLAHADALLKQRLARLPIAYITDSKEFYGREFTVTPKVLIPRPETEAVIELVKKYAKRSSRLLDVGTGSGCIGITLQLELPGINSILSDVSPAALAVARKNARRLGAKPTRYIQSDLLDYWLRRNKPKRFDSIIANLPYVDKSWERSPETDHEPSLALFAENGGLKLIERLLEEAPFLLTSEGLLVLEADPEQHTHIVTTAARRGFTHLETQGYALALRLTTTDR